MCRLILLYFGSFNSYFPLFLKSVAANPSFDLLLITDNTVPYDYPSNITKIETSFERLRKRIQEKFDFLICLDRPYKLCDFKPAYGYIFEEWLEGYSYWGHCDSDLIFGDLLPVTQLMTQEYDKIFAAGHLTLYRNTYENNRVFQTEYKGCEIFRQAFTTPQCLHFDEVYFAVNVQRLFEQQGKRLYTGDISYNCDTDHTGLCRMAFHGEQNRWRPEKTVHDQLYWQNGSLVRVGRKGRKLWQQPFIYAHFQHRPLQCATEQLTDQSCFYIQSDRIRAVPHLPQSVREYCKSKCFQPIFCGLIRWLRKIKSRIFDGAYWKYNPYP